MKIIERLRRESALLKNRAALICAGAGGLSALIVLAACGNFYLYSFLLLPRHAPPAFIFYFMFVFTTALIFYSGGIAYFGARCGAGKVLPVLDLLSALFFVIFYISFVSAAAFVFALLMLLVTAAVLFFAFRETLGESLILTVIHALLALLCLNDILLTAGVILLN